MGARSDLSIRMKSYEARSSGRLTPRVPIIVRVDGKAFHTFTRNLTRPFAPGFMDSMQTAAVIVSGEMAGFRLAYVQSDEASFLLEDTENLDTEQWFGGRIDKLVSVSASLFAVELDRDMSRRYGVRQPTPCFDARAFSVPEEDVPNYFLWRHQDWNRNSLQMLAQAHYSHAELHGMNAAAMHEMLHAVGVNWANLTPREKDGTYIDRNGELQFISEPSYDAIRALYGKEGS